MTSSWDAFTRADASPPRGRASGRPRRRRRQAPAAAATCVAQRGRLVDAEVDVEREQVVGQQVEVVGAGRQQRALARRSARATPTVGGTQLGEHVERRVELDAGLVAVRRGGDRRLHEGHRVGRVVELDPVAGRLDGGQAVDAQRAPGVALAVAGDEVPAPGRADDAVRVERPLGLGAPAVAVADPQPLAVPAGPGDRDQHVGRDRVAPRAPSRVVIEPIVPTWRRSVGGSSCSSLPSARIAASPPPSIDSVAVERRHTATATASSRSSISGGIVRPPAPRW